MIRSALFRKGALFAIAKERVKRDARVVARVFRGTGGLPQMPALRAPQPHRARRGQPQRRADVHRRGPGAGGGSAGPALRRPLGRAADADDPRHRHRALRRVHLQRGQVPSAAEPQSRAGRGRGVPGTICASRWRWSGPGSSCCWAKSPAATRCARRSSSRATMAAGYERKGTWFMPTFHPSALLRDPTKKRDAWDDFQKIRAKLNEIEEATGVSVSDGEVARGADEVH